MIDVDAPVGWNRHPSGPNAATIAIVWRDRASVSSGAPNIATWPVQPAHIA